MILVSMTYEIVTQESAEQGDADSRGYEWQDMPHTFRELVERMREHPEPSSSPLHAAGAHDWFTSYPDTDYRTGEEKTTSIHYSRANDARSLKYWRMAAHVAGLTT
jgi:hypothetical protein